MRRKTFNEIIEKLPPLKKLSPNENRLDHFFDLMWDIKTERNLFEYCHFRRTVPSPIKSALAEKGYDVKQFERDLIRFEFKK